MKLLFSTQDVLFVLNPLWLTRNPTDCNGDSLGYTRQRWMIRSKVASKGGGHGSRVMIDTEVQKYRVILMVNITWLVAIDFFRSKFRSSMLHNVKSKGFHRHSDYIH